MVKLKRTFHSLLALSTVVKRNLLFSVGVVTDMLRVGPRVVQVLHLKNPPPPSLNDYCLLGLGFELDFSSGFQKDVYFFFGLKRFFNFILRHKLGVEIQRR